MAGKYIECALFAQNIKNEVKEYFAEIKETYGLVAPTPLLFVVRCGDNPASEIYVRNKKKVCEEVGIVLVDKKVEPTFDAMMNAVATSSLEAYHRGGVIMQLPLPDNFTDEEKDLLLQFIDNECDVDGLGKGAYFIPCTALGIMDVIKGLCDEGVFPNDLAGTNVTIIGRSPLVGSPLRDLLLDTDATLTLCHSKTKDIREHIQHADIIVCAVGKKDFITKEMLADNTSDRLTVIDVGINRDENGKVCGDCSKDVIDVAQYVTPVPKGIGLLTTARLVHNVMLSYLRGVDTRTLDKKIRKAKEHQDNGYTKDVAEKIASVTDVEGGGTKRMKEKIKIKYHNPNLTRLERTKKGDCIDLRLNDVSVLHSYDYKNTMIKRGADDNFICCRYQKGDVLMLDFGVSMALPRGYKANIYPRSSTFKNTKWLLTNCVGIIDNSYRHNKDTWKAMVYCMSDGFVAFDERYFQFEIVPVMNFYTDDFVEVDELEDGERGGYGTSGVQ